MFCLYTFPATNLNFQWKWRWWDWIQAIFLNLFYFILKDKVKAIKSLYITGWILIGILKLLWTGEKGKKLLKLCALSMEFNNHKDYFGVGLGFKVCCGWTKSWFDKLRDIPMSENGNSPIFCSNWPIQRFKIRPTSNLINPKRIWYKVLHTIGLTNHIFWLLSSF